MLYTKSIEKITYQDILDFCNERYRESIHLDYKVKIDSSLAKNIAAMANTWGGLILIGVDEVDSKPKLPVEGLEYREHLREQINNLILGNIMPPIFPEIQVCQSEEGNRALIVVRVFQSDLTPHAIRGNTRVYIRTDTSNEPEELASVDRILWLIEKRRKSVELKNDFYERADKRFSILCRKGGISVEHMDAFFGMSPLYPFEILADYRKLAKEIVERIKSDGWSSTFPMNLYNSRFEPTQNGVYSFFLKESKDYFSYEEVNHYGFFYHREEMYFRQEINGVLIQNSLLSDILIRLDLFLESMSKFYNVLGYWGILELRVHLGKLSEVVFRDLPPPRGYMRFDEIKASPVDNMLEFSKTISYAELKNNRKELVVDWTAPHELES